MNRQATARFLRRAASWLQAVVLLLVAQSVFAEGSVQVGPNDFGAPNQPLYEYGTTSSLLLPIQRPIYVDVLLPVEVVNIAVCGKFDSDDLRVQVYSTTTGLDGKPNTGSLLNTWNLSSGNISCSSPMNSLITNRIIFNPPSTGTYEIRLFNLSQSNGRGVFKRFDITVTPSALVLPDPRIAAGRLWAYSWGFNTGSYSESLSSDADYYTLAPGGFPNTNYVWKLDLNNFAGYVYEIVSNDVGVNAPRSGLSTNQAGNSVTPKYPVYLGYPARIGSLGPPGAGALGISDFTFTDDAGVDSSISPSTTITIQDTGDFTFNSNAEGVYTITIDKNQDGQFGAGDVLLLGPAVAGANSVRWNGHDNLGVLVPSGTYDAQLEVRLGEFHFVAGDAETSGGPGNDGLTIRQVSFSNPLIGTPTEVYWDDETLLGGSASVPNGIVDGKHNWGTFSGAGFGNRRYIDTYVYGQTATSTTFVFVNPNDTPVIPVLELNKSAPLSTALGGGFSYSIDVANIGLVDATNVTLTDIVPAGAPVSSASATVGSCLPSGQTVNCSLGTIAAEASVTVTINVTASSLGTLQNTATGRIDGGTPVSSNTVSTDVTSSGFSQLSVAKTADPADGETVLPGQQIDYTIVVANSGSEFVGNIDLTDAFPAGVTYTPTTAMVTSPPARGASDNLELLPVSYTGGTGWSGGWVETDPDETGNSPTAGKVKIERKNTQCFDDDTNTAETDAYCISLKKKATGTVVGIERNVDLSGAGGAALSFCYALKNNGAPLLAKVNGSTVFSAPAPTTGDVNQQCVPSPIDISAYTGGTATVRFEHNGDQDRWVDSIQILASGAGSVTVAGNDPGAGAINASSLTLGAGQQITATFSVTVDDPTSETQIINAATASSTIANVTSNTVSHPVATGADVAITKTADAAAGLTAGEVLTYTLDVTNNGPEATTNVSIAETFPAEFQNPEYSLDSGTNWLPWADPLNIGDIIANPVTPVSVLVRGTIDPTLPADTTITNTAGVTSDKTDDIPDNDTASVDTDAFKIINANFFGTVYLDANQNETLDGEGATGLTDLWVKLISKTVSDPATLDQVIQVTQINPATGAYSLLDITEGDYWLILDDNSDPLDTTSNLPTGWSFTGSQTGQLPLPPALDNFVQAVGLDVNGLDYGLFSASDVSLTKTAGRAFDVGPDKHVTFTITVTNNGPDEVQSVEVTDTPTAMAIVGATPSQGTYSAVLGTWDVGDLAAAGFATLDITFEMDLSDTNREEWPNVAEVTAMLGTDPDSTPNNGVTTEDDYALAIAKVGVDVTGAVYDDTNRDGQISNGESGIENIYVTLYDTVGTTCETVQTDANGDFIFSGVATGEYKVIEAGETAPTACPPPEADPVGYISTTTNTRLITVAETAVPNQNFGDALGVGLSGTVLEDNGMGGGTAHDGIVNGSENGIGGVTVQLTDPTGSTVYDSTTTNADGTYMLFIPDAAIGAPVRVIAETLGGFLSASANVGTTGGAASPDLDNVGFTPVAGTSYTGVNFGDIRDPAWAPDNTGQALPGTTVFYAHTFTAYTAGDVTFSVSNEVTTPSGEGWNTILYQDTDCSGSTNDGEAVITGPIATDADTNNQVCVVAKVFVPANAPFNAQYQVELTADFDITGDGTPEATQTRTDLTTVGDPANAGLVITKAVDKPTAKPGETLTYTITYRNIGTEVLDNIEIQDATPAFTNFVSASCPAAFPNSITACAVSLAPAGGATGGVEWTLTGSLDPGQEGNVTYQVQVDN